MVRTSCAEDRVLLSSLWQRKLLVGGTVWGRGRSRNLALHLPGTRDRKRARRSTTSGVAWEFCCSGEMLRFWETGSPTSHHHKLMDWMSKNLWFTISIALSLTQSSVHLLEIYPSTSIILQQHDDIHHVGARWWRAEGKISRQYDYHYMKIRWSSYDVRIRFMVRW